MGTTLETAWRFCANLVKSGISPRGIDTPAKAFYVVMKGLEMGVGPVSALDNIHIIEGKTSLSAKLMLARMHAAGFKTFPKRCDAEAAEIEVTSPDGRTGTVSFTMAEAKHITYWTKDWSVKPPKRVLKNLVEKDNWSNYPADMLFARCASRAVNRYCPESVIGGASTPDELGLVVDPEGAIEVEPESVTTVENEAKTSETEAGSIAEQEATSEGPSPAPGPRSSLDPKIRARLIAVAREASALSAEGDVIHLEPLWAKMMDREGDKTAEIDSLNEAEGLVLGKAIKDSLDIPASMLND